MSGAILQPPTRPDADWGVLYIEVSGCLPMCGHGTIGVATVLVETGMVAGDRAGHDDPPRHPGRAGRRRGAGRRRPRERGHHRERAVVRARLDAVVDVPGLGAVRYDLAYGGNFYAIVPLADLGMPFDRAEKDRILDRRAGHHGRDQRAATGRATRSTRRSRGCKHVQFTRARARRRGLAQRHGDPPRLVRPLAVRHRHLGPDGAAARARRAGARRRTSSTSPSSGTRFIGRLVAESRVGDVPAVVPTITGRAWITGTAQYLLDPTDPFPEGFVL